MPLITFAGTWSPLTNQPTFLNPPSQCAQYPNPNCAPPGQGYSYGGVRAPLLMTDGSVLVEAIAVDEEGNAIGQEYKFSPDKKGSYINGTWTRVASLPGDYWPLYFASAVLPDGRVIYEGGEYDTVNLIMNFTARGAIYDPVADSWTSIAPPAFFVPNPVFHFEQPLTIGDAPSVVLPDGTFMLGNCCSSDAAFLDPKTLTWRQAGTSGKNDDNVEEGWVLLPDGKVLTIDTYVSNASGLIDYPGCPVGVCTVPYPTDPTNAEIYDPLAGSWSSAGSTINTLTSRLLAERGPDVLRPDGTVFATGSQGNTSIFNTRTGQWSVGPRFPISAQGYQCTLQDSPAALLPNANVLVACTGGKPGPSGFSSSPTYWYEFDGQKLIPEPSVPDASFLRSYDFNMVILPTGQILQTDFNTDVRIYTPDDRSFNPSWAPNITHAPDVVSPGRAYKIEGIRFNGMSQGGMYGDDYQSATNYPLVRITNLKTGHVFYSRTHDHSSMGVAVKGPVFTYFDVPSNQELGKSKLEVVANGISSKPKYIEVIAK